MRASDLLISKIKEFEGFSSTAYTCAGGVLTCGYGHTKGVRINDRCTGNEAERWLLEDLAPIETYLNTIPEVDTQGKYDALCSFIFNLGMGNFKSSTLLKKIKAERIGEKKGVGSRPLGGVILPAEHDGCAFCNRRKMRSLTSWDCC